MSSIKYKMVRIKEKFVIKLEGSLKLFTPPSSNTIPRVYANSACLFILRHSWKHVTQFIRLVVKCLLKHFWLVWNPPLWVDNELIIDDEDELTLCHSVLPWMEINFLKNERESLNSHHVLSMPFWPLNFWESSREIKRKRWRSFGAYRVCVGFAPTHMRII